MLSACGGGGGSSSDDHENERIDSPPSSSPNNNVDGNGNNSANEGDSENSGDENNRGYSEGGSDRPASEIPEPIIPAPMEGGRFVTADEGEGVYFPSSYSAFLNYAHDCAQTHNFYYFETDRVRVYGDQNLPEDDFRQVASLVEQGAEQALPLMQLSNAQLDAYRPFYLPDIAQVVLEFLVQIRNSQSEGLSLQQIAPGFSAPDGWAQMNENVALHLLSEYWNNANDETQQSIVTRLMENPVSETLFPMLSPEDKRMPDQILVCMSASINRQVYGSLYGVNMAPPSVVPVESRTLTYVLHALIHTLQINIAAPESGTLVADRWFYEGQASLLSGQDVADEHEGYNPVTVVLTDDERSQFGSEDARLPYAHYARAYQYLSEHNSEEDLAQVWLSMRSRQLADGDYDELSDPLFSTAFGQNIKQANGNVLSLKEYREKYQQLLPN